MCTYVHLERGFVNRLDVGSEAKPDPALRKELVEVEPSPVARLEADVSSSKPLKIKYIKKHFINNKSNSDSLSQ